ncbi:hypothetical protein [Sulfurovum sp.]|uniref:hypothetical protein n=1 Tax=Sulfurovum sp. TaxID=1969726 RepID=UPI00260082C4|nr:hypothetical protein [Sulfurovum sp.]
MKKHLFILTLLSSLLFSATPEQVEQYISVSNSEEQLIELESQFSQMQNNINKLDSNSSKESNSYDMQLLSIRFREYLQKNLSEDEMNEILQQYKSMLLLQFVSAQNDPEYDPKKAARYVKELQENPEASVRIELAQKIAEALYKKDSITILFDNLIKPLMENSIGGSKMNDEAMKESRKTYIKMMLEEGKTEAIYLTKDFTQEELEALLKIVKTPAMDHESKAVFGAMAYALKEFFLSMASRYDIGKHQR